MTEGDRPLPRPPRARFGGEPRDEATTTPALTSDRMALAAAEGRLEEFLKSEIPQGDHARDLAMMMMGMSGIMPPDASPGMPATVQAPNAIPGSLDAGPGAPPEVPEEVRAAIQQGDVANLKELLRAEHARRSGSAAPFPVHPASPSPTQAGEGRAGIDAAVIDELIRIGSDNDVTVDWLMLRAVRLYVEEYRKTGRL